MSVCHFGSASSLRPPKMLTTLGACSPNYLGATLPDISFKLSSRASGYYKRSPVCLFGGEGKSQNDDQVKFLKVLKVLFADPLDAVIG